MNYYLIDLENVHDRGLFGSDLLGADCTIVIFYSSTANSITKFSNDLLMAGAVSVVYQPVNVHLKNALDFELAVYTGELLADGNTEGIFIISEDQGYKAVLDIARRHNKKVRLHRSVLEAWYMSERQDSEEKMRTVIGIKEVKKAASAKKLLLNAAMRLQIDPGKFIQITCPVKNNRKYIYIRLLHTFGKEKGLQAYHLEFPGIKYNYI